MTKVKVVVIGGGIIGTSILYHLAKRGWSDCVLLEKTVLTAGSTWHAAANGNTLNPIPNIARLQRNSIALYSRLEEETGQSISQKRPGGLMIATTNDRMSEYRATHATGRRLGFKYELIGPEEILHRHPLTNVDGVIGALWEPLDGHIDPFGTTQALAIGARKMGATIRQHSEVMDLHQESNGSWRVITKNEDYTANWIVNAAGLWANDVAKLTGAKLAMTPMEHHYLITESVPQIKSLNKELPLIRDPDASFYMRQELNGLLLGIYENRPKPWGVNGIAKHFEQELLPSDLDRLLPNLQLAFERFPALTDVGIKKDVNGPFVFSPDARPLLGPMPGQRNHFCAAAFIAGLNMGGGFGDLIAEWIMTGRTDMDMSSCDVGRFGDWGANDNYRVTRAIDTYATRYHQHYPHEERNAGRPVRTFPLYEHQQAKGAVFGSANGWERPTWFAVNGEDAHDIYSFGRQNWFDTVGEEARAVRRDCGLMDASVFAKYRVAGAQAKAFLEQLLACSIPSRTGQIRLAHMLDKTGGIIGEFSIVQRKTGVYFLVGAAAAETMHMRWMLEEARDFDCHIECVSAEQSVLALAGPYSRKVLQKLTHTDVSNRALPFLNAIELSIDNICVYALRVSFTGELGYELYSDVHDQVALYYKLHEAGSEFGLRDFGARALDALRLEKGYPRYGSELNTEVTPFEAGLGFAIDMHRGGFTGYEALVATKRDNRIRHQIVSISIEEGEADPVANETLFCEGEIAGYVTSGAYGYNVGQALAMALLKPAYAQAGQNLQVDILGKHRNASVVAGAHFDPAGVRMRS